MKAEANEIAVRLEHVSMRFNMSRERVDSIKEYLIKAAKRQLFFDEFWALKDVSFEVNQGEVFGLVGLNGAGKSTLLKVIAGVLKPTTGTVSVSGSIAPLIELGAGFDGDLTARENVYMNGAVLGYNKAYMEQRYQEIMDFAELWDFADVPVKNFSSGMYARLGFSIATLVKPEILIVDEILGVGDFKFQEKCRDRIRELMSGGTTVLMVSHSNDTIKNFCDRAAWLENGKVKMIGPADEVCACYEQQ
ncbi:MAG: ABC transporter ATP-binding protein [Ruminococcus flavefaciens]|nr:ABC transporter ATP-binding protein [Ruminococcus flavefaciens]